MTSSTDQRLQSDRDANGHSPSNRFRALVGYRTQAWREGYGEIALDIRDDHMNSLGIVHGGVYAALLDAAFGQAACWCAVEGNVRSAVTVSLNTVFLATIRTGRLVGYGRVEHVEGRMATLTGEIVADDGTLCATGQAAFLYMPGSEHRDGVPRKGR